MLWKRGGHPAAARSLEQLNAQTELLDLAAPLRLSTECVGSSLLSEQPSHLALWADADLRHEPLTAACTIESIAQLQLAHSGEGENQAPIEQLADIPRTVALRLEKVKQQSQRDTEAPEADASPSVAPLPVWSRVSTALWPLQDYATYLW